MEIPVTNTLKIYSVLANEILLIFFLPFLIYISLSHLIYMTCLSKPYRSTTFLGAM